MIVARCNGKSWWVAFEGTEMVVYTAHSASAVVAQEVQEFVAHLGLQDAITDEGWASDYFMYQTYEITQAKVPGPRKQMGPAVSERDLEMNRLKERVDILLDEVTANSIIIAAQEAELKAIRGGSSDPLDLSPEIFKLDTIRQYVGTWGGEMTHCREYLLSVIDA